MNEERIESELRGKTLRVYWYLLEHNAESGVGAREAQRALGFSSPTLAVYHLDKLAELGLVEKRHGEYHLVREVKVGVLKQFVRVGALLLPRHLFYATMFTTLLILYGVYLTEFEQPNFSSVFAIIFGTLGAITSWYETFKAWRGKTGG